ncbi:hypothetical protein SS50377_27076 [Spironucleus salmonicida]|uniref:Uncharacterized protein n=1 Tax=Spironucleus salmonicida TaxID=348837 RepID=V6LUX9_9EUKA|nr:hypothetical protein SS50377_27076 [Spironucleus salmonicida]|eukprot:EST48058.1 Hypothetical protein SS50377_11825 [Spironucleus salmonicida]
MRLIISEKNLSSLNQLRVLCDDAQQSNYGNIICCKTCDLQNETCGSCFAGYNIEIRRFVNDSNSCGENFDSTLCGIQFYCKALLIISAQLASIQTMIWPVIAKVPKQKLYTVYKFYLYRLQARYICNKQYMYLKYVCWRIKMNKICLNNYSPLLQVIIPQIASNILNPPKYSTIAEYGKTMSHMIQQTLNMINFQKDLKLLMNVNAFKFRIFAINMENLPDASSNNLVIGISQANIIIVQIL